MTGTAALLLAAGRSMRFGSPDKLLAPFRGQTVIAAAMAALETPRITMRLAVVSSQRVATAVQRAGFEPLIIAAGQPQSASLAAGVRHLAGRDLARIVVALGDMPFLRRDDFDALITLAGDGAACARRAAQPMVPAVFPRVMFDRLCHVAGDEGARRFLTELPGKSRLPIPAERLRDIDTQDDLARTGG
ncbi:nucleotidyltransferase family protein [Paracoccus sediminicola]|uniref:nucleotidyltransferase family protein n=1 Tax=Paracoccus sediminicola TaxID=3017783 RepID=UPI0022EFDE13|nr:nucleotidyltransferase family protein [Paracoccus sediminicola]WBU57366.1 nucleotidyltransferase family protein [Paracoccus sediminicola]